MKKMLFASVMVCLLEFACTCRGESGVESKVIPAGNIPVSIRPGLLGDSGVAAGDLATVNDLATKLSISNITQTVTSDTNTVPSNKAVVRYTEPSVFPALNQWAKTRISSASLGIISDSTGSDDSWPKQIYNLLTNNFADVTVRLWQYNSATTNMDLKSSSLGSAGIRALAWSNSTVSASIANFNPTGEVDIAVQATLADWSDANEPWLLIRPADAPISFNTSLRLYWNGKPRVYYGTNGGYATALSPTALSFTNGATGWVRATGKMSTGVFSFYESLSGTNWIFLGAVTNASGEFATNGTTIYLATGNAASTNSGFNAVVWRDGIDGQIMTPPIDQWYRSVPSNSVISGSPAFDIFNGSWPGAKSSDWTADKVKKALPQYVSMVLFNIGLNDTYPSSGAYTYESTYGSFSTLASNVNSACPNFFGCVLSQNPWASTEPRGQIFPIISRHQQTAAKKLGMEKIDTYSEYIAAGWSDAWLTDIVHPTWGSQQTNGTYIYKRIFY